MTAVETIGLLVGVIGTSIAVYQAAIINETRKRKNELQYLFAGIHASAVHKQQAWQHQISPLPQPLKQREKIYFLRGLHKKKTDLFI